MTQTERLRLECQALRDDMLGMREQMRRAMMFADLPSYTLFLRIYRRLEEYLNARLHVLNVLYHQPPYHVPTSTRQTPAVYTVYGVTTDGETTS